MAFLTPNQQQQTKKARNLLEALGTPTVNDLKAMIRMNLIRSNNVTSKDMDLAKIAFRPDLGTIKGKRTREQPTPIEDSRIKVPSELLSIHKEVAISIDVMKVNSLPFLMMISNKVFYRTTKYLTSTLAESFQNCLDENISVYTRGDLKTIKRHCDNKFHSALDIYSTAQDPSITITYSAAQEHVPCAEQNN
eukprot:1340244-Ditylum_brightwellii.AAC.1